MYDFLLIVLERTLQNQTSQSSMKMVKFIITVLYKPHKFNQLFVEVQLITV